MRVLYIDEEIPYPCTSGKKTRTYNLLIRLAQFHLITYVAYVDKKKDRELIAQLESHNIKVESVAPRRAHRGSFLFYILLLINLFSKYPYIVSGHYTKRMHNCVRKLLNSTTYDLIHCEISPYAVFTKGINNIPKIVVAHNIESEIWKGYLEYEKNVFKRTYINLQFKKVKKFESTELNRFCSCIAVSNRDAEILSRNRWIKKSDVVENGVDIEYFSNQTVNTLRRFNLVFTGSMDWLPNQDGVIYFTREILPLILKENENVTFTVVGRTPPPAIMSLHTQYPQVEITGTVNDVRPYISSAHVYVAPLRIGGGTRLKILEAMAMGKAIVATRLAAEGLEIQNGEHLILTDTSDEFACKILFLFQNPDYAKKLGLNARKCVEQKYSWDYLAAKNNKVWNRVVNSFSKI